MKTRDSLASPSGLAPGEERSRRDDAQGTRRSRQRRIEIICALLAVLFSAGVVVLISAGHRAGNAISLPSPAATPVAAGKVSVRQAGAIREYSVLSPRAALMMPAVAPDGHIWAGEMGANRLLELDPTTGVMREYALPWPAGADVMGTVVDRRQRVWFTLEGRDTIGRFEPAAGDFAEFRLPSAGGQPLGIALDAAGNIWFTELARAVIGVLDTGTNAIREFDIPSGGPAYWLAAGPTGAIWFTEPGIGKGGAGKIGRLEPATGQIEEWKLPSVESQPTGIALDADGNVWFAENGASTLGRLLPNTGRIDEYPLPAATRPSGLVVADDGTIWLSTSDGSVINQFLPASGSFRQITLPSPNADAFWPAKGIDGAVWYVEAGANKLARVTP